MHQQQELNLYGITIIKQDGAEIANEVFNLWADLFACAPSVLKLTGSFSWIEGEEPYRGSYSTIKVDRDKTVKQFRQLAAYAEEVAEGNDNTCILHLGI